MKKGDAALFAESLEQVHDPSPYVIVRTMAKGTNENVVARGRDGGAEDDWRGGIRILDSPQVFTG